MASMVSYIAIRVMKASFAADQQNNLEHTGQPEVTEKAVG